MDPVPVSQYIGGLVDTISNLSWRLPAADSVVTVLHSMPMCAAGPLYACSLHPGFGPEALNCLVILSRRVSHRTRACPCRSPTQAIRVLSKALRACKKAMAGSTPAGVPALLHQLISFAERNDLRSDLAQVRSFCLGFSL